MKLNFKKIGEGFPMVLLHGFLGSSDSLLRVGKHFSTNFLVYIPDLRNHGLSPHHPEMNYKIMAKDISVFFDEQNIQKAIIVGHSMGGKVAMQCAFDFPHIIEKLVIADIGIKSYSNELLEFMHIIKPLDFTAYKTRNEIRQLLSVIINDENIVSLLLKNIYRDSNNHLRWRFDIDILCHNLVNILSSLSSDKNFEKPVLFIKGALSDFINNDDISILKEKFPSMLLKEVSDSGHWVHAENYNEFINSLEEFLEN